MTTEEKPIIIKAVFEALDPRERLILFAYYVLGMPLKWIGEELGVSRERVRQIRERGFRRICKAIERIGGVEMVWDALSKVRGFQAPIVSLHCYRRNRGSYVFLKFSSRAVSELSYKDENWCNIFKEDGRLRFEFSDRQITNVSRKVGRRQTKDGSLRVSICLRQSSVSAFVLPSDNCTYYLLESKEPKMGIIDLREPVKREDYLVH